MYRIMVDGQEVYSPALSNDLEHQILSPSLQLEIDTAGSLSFILPPGHKAYDSIRKLKSVVTMEWDGVEIFRGRVLEEKTDAYNQKEIYCEGDLSLLLDSVQRPFKHESITKRAFIEQAIASHNEQVEEYKRFTLGDFSALTDDAAIPLESDGYADTLSAIRAVLETHEGYLFTRHEKGIRYLDFLTTHRANTGQVIEFGVNLVDLDNQTAAGELCTVLLPIGGMLEDGTTVTIASVNGGKDTIEDAEAIAQYGRIVKTYAFDDITDPAELLKLAQEKLASMAITETLILKAVDMHLLDETKGIILPGIPVLIHTKPHGFDNQRKMCTALDMNPDSPGDATYTFGQPTKTQSGAAALIASKVEKHTRTVEKIWKHYTETDYKVQIHAGLLDGHDKYISEAFIAMDGINAQLLLKADHTEVIEQGQRLSEAMVALDGVNAQIALKASQADVQKLEGDVEGVTTRLSKAEIAIDGANAAIALKADQSQVTDQGERLTKAEVNIDGMKADILLKASHEELNKMGERVSKAEASIQINANGIESKVSRNGIISAINQTAESVRISANKINLDGYVTMKDFEALQGTVENLWSEQLIVDSVSANHVAGGEADFDNLVFGTIAGKSSDAWVTGIINNQSSLQVGGATVATQSWVSGRGYATQNWVNSQGFDTTGSVNTKVNNLSNWVLENYPTKAWINAQNYLTSGALTTKEITVVSSVNTTKGTYAAGFTVVTNVTYNTTKYTIVTFA